MGWLGKRNSDVILGLARPRDTKAPGSIASPAIDELRSTRLKAVLAIWQDKSPGSDSLPPGEEFDILDYAVAMGNVSLVSVQRDPLDFIFRVHCVNAASYLDEDMTGRSVKDYRDPQFSELVRTVFARATENRRAHVIIEDVLMADNRVARWEAAVMPLQDNEGQVSSLVVAFEILN